MSNHMINETDPDVAPTPHVRGQRFGRRGILLLGAGGAVAVGLGSVATRGAFADAGTLAAATTSSATSTLSGRHGGTAAGPGRPGAGFGPSAGMGPGFGPPLGGRHGGWTVSAVNGATISAKQADGTTLTITTTGSTVFQVTRPGQQRTAGALTDVGVGKQIDVIGTLTGSGTVTAATVDVQPARAGGQVTAIAGTAVTVSGGRSTTQQIHLAAGATYRLETFTGGSAGSTSDVQIGSMITAEGTLNSDGSLQAQLVQIAPPSIDGTVTSIANGAIMVQRPARPPRLHAATGMTATATASSATVQTIHVTASTRYLVSTTYGPGITSAGSLTNVTTGVHVHAVGTHNGDGSLTATTVLIASTASRAGTLPAQ